MLSPFHRHQRCFCDEAEDIALRYSTLLEPYRMYLFTNYHSRPSADLYEMNDFQGVRVASIYKIRAPSIPNSLFHTSRRANNSHTPSIDPTQQFSATRKRNP